MCPTCAGAGEVISEYCRKCSGEGRIRVKKNIKVKVPPGVSTGSILRVAGEGDVGPKGYIIAFAIYNLSLIMLYFVNILLMQKFQFAMNHLELLFLKYFLHRN